MAAKLQRITPFFWFDDQAEEAVRFYTSVFENSRVLDTVHYSKAGSNAAGRPEGSVMIVTFHLSGQDFTALNGGPHFKFNEAISLVVNCESQKEIDHYWNHLTEGGDEKAQQCGWLKDRYGVSWQVVPAEIGQLMNDADPDKSQRVMEAVLQMKKIDLEVLRKAAAG